MHSLYFDNPYSDNIGKVEYDGLVVKIKAHVFFSSNPTRSRHVHLGVADTKDQDFDSALFVKKQGFTSTNP
jgi:hypothetical protein